MMSVVELFLLLNLGVSCAILYKLYTSETMFVELMEKDDEH